MTVEPPVDPPPASGGAPPRSVPMTTFVVVVVVLVALVGAMFAWVVLRDDGGDTAAARASTTTTTEPEPGDAAEDPLGNLDDLLGDDGLGALEGLLGDGTLGTAGLECLSGGLDGLLGGGERLDLPDDPRAQYEAVARFVEEDRQLQFDQIPEPIFVTRAEMRDRLAALTERDYPDDVARADQELLTALGAIEPGTDLAAENAKLLGEEVAGYYDPVTGELVVLGDDGEPFDALELSIIAHELEHALADQALDLPIDEDPRTDDPDAAQAARALIEGDATLTQTDFQFSALDPLDLLAQAFGGDAAASQQALAEAPPFLAKQLLFPYDDGLAFVCGRRQRGWGSVDDLYRNPPTTTAQILFPERYERGEGAVDAPDPVKPDGAGWEQIRHMTFGAADLMFLLDIAGVSDPRDAVESWAGGEVTQWRRGDEVAVRLSLVRSGDGDRLCTAVQAWVDTLDGATVECSGDDVRVSL